MRTIEQIGRARRKAALIRVLANMALQTHFPFSLVGLLLNKNTHIF